MNFKKYTSILILISFFSCKNEISNEISNEVIELNNKSLLLANSRVKDSIVKAIEIIDMVISKYPKNEVFISNKVNFLCKLQKYKEAYNELKKIKNIKENDYNFYLIEGLILEKLEEEKKALICYGKGLSHVNDKLKKNHLDNSLIIEKFIYISLLHTKEEALKQFKEYIKNHPTKEDLEIKNIIANFEKSDLI